MNKLCQMTIMVYLEIVTHQEMIVSCIGHTKIVLFTKLIYIYICVCVCGTMFHTIPHAWCSDGSLGLSEVSVDLQDLQMADTKCMFRIPRLNRRLYSCFPWGITQKSGRLTKYRWCAVSGRRELGILPDIFVWRSVKLVDDWDVNL